MMRVHKTISRITDPEKQQAETDRYWRCLSIGERLTAVWELSQEAYSFAAAFRGNLTHDAKRPQGAITRIQRSPA
jgi:hypothetical protein